MPPPTSEPGVAGNFSRSAAPLFGGEAGLEAGAGVGAGAGAGAGAVSGDAAPALALAPREASFSQYPRCGDTGDSVEQGSCNNVKKSDFKYMGYSARSESYRYTAWMQWDGQRLGVDWASPPYAEELYNHTGDDGTDFDAFENENLLAHSANQSTTVVAARERLFAALQRRFAPYH